MDKEQLQNLIKELIEKTTVKTTGISIIDDGSKRWFGVEVNEPHFFIERGGEALQALNHLVRRIVESKMLPTEVGTENNSNNIVIDINGFQKKRIENVRSLAHIMSERARYFKSNIEIDPMSSFERRIVHEFLANAIDLKTESIGLGPSRRVVIKYVGAI